MEDAGLRPNQLILKVLRPVLFFSHKRLRNKPISGPNPRIL